jgi:hypothetical protein
MQKSGFSYRLKLMKLDQIWLPFAFWALFAIVGIITREQDKFYDLTRIFLSVVPPLITGILSAYALLDDPTLELKFAAPVSTNRLLLERLGAIFFIQMVLALAFEGYAFLMHTELSPLGGFWQLQLVWLVPCLATMMLGSFAAIAGASSISGAVTIGLLWILQAILHSFFAANSITRYFFWFMGGLNPENPVLPWNQSTLTVLSLVFLVIALRLLRRQERYI